MLLYEMLHTGYVKQDARATEQSAGVWLNPIEKVPSGSLPGPILHMYVCNGVKATATRTLVA